MKYKAIALSEKYDGGRKAGEIELKGSLLIFSSKGEEIKVSSYEIEFSIGGANDRLIYINHPKWIDFSIYTTDKIIFQDPLLAKNTSLSQVVLARKNNSKNLVFILAGLALVGALILLGFIQSRDAIVRGLANQIPIELEQQLGDKLLGISVNQNDIIRDPLLQKMLNEAVAPIVAQVTDAAFHFHFQIIKDPSLNAFALPGGNVVINSGMLIKSSSWEELQGVVAHEISHVTQRHHARGVLNRLGVFFFISVVIGDVSAIAETVGHYGSQIESLMYSRDFESEADAVGWDYLIKANINPEGMITFFEKIQSEEKEQEQVIDSELMNFVSTHPATKDRIKVLNQKKKDLNSNNFTNLDLDFEEFKNRVKLLTNK